MNWIFQFLWLIPVLPLLAAALTAFAKRRHRALAASLAIGSMVSALALSCLAFARVVQDSGRGGVPQLVFNFAWFQFGETWLKLGWVLDPLSAIMLVMVSLIALLIFIYSLSYMDHDENFTRFFCFLSLFAAAMLGLVIANSLLLFFICWELVGLTSYLLIGFWYQKPSAAAAAKKAFIVTRIGDLAFLLGIVWLYSQAGTLLFYEDGHGCLEQSSLAALVERTTRLGIAASTGIALLIFCGAIGKSGQVPLHVWLPDAMEGPTPVSALIHAATMVAAGVFLVARVYPLMAASPGMLGSATPTTALTVVTWLGAITAVFAASIAVAQTDIKRILAYSTVSQLGFMMLGLGTGGVAVGMFHLITHAFFKALLFLGAGSVIHGCHEEQDIRRMGGLRKPMPVTFATYAVGMLALSGFPLLFSGFWSKDGILEAAHVWRVSHWPFYLGILGAFLTAFYMTRQVLLVFFGPRPGAQSSSSVRSNQPHRAELELCALEPHESPRLMTIPLVVLSAFSMFLGFIGTPAWPWFQRLLSGTRAAFEPDRLFDSSVLAMMCLSTVLVLAGLGFGWWLYGRKSDPGKVEAGFQPASDAASLPRVRAGRTQDASSLAGWKPASTTLPLPEEPDPLERIWPNVFVLLKNKFFVDELYDSTIVAFNAWWAGICDWLDRWIWDGGVQLLSWTIVGLSWLNRLFDEYVVNLGFDESCGGLTQGGGLMSRLQNGRVQNYLRILALGLLVLVLFLVWGCRAS